MLPGTALPLQLRANDVVRHIINVDSRFRDTPASSSSSDFFLTLLSPVRNVLRVRVTSVEFPNNYWTFTVRRRNVTLEVIYDLAAPKTVTLVIPEGNYTAGEMVDALTAAIAAAGPALSWLSVTFDETTGSFTFSGGATYFAINTAVVAADATWDRPFDYGLGYYLGFTRKCHVATRANAGAPYLVMSDQCATFAGDSYVFLRLNDLACVRQTNQVYDVTGRERLEANDFTALAKIVLREPKNYMSFDDYASQHAKEVVFPAPTDLSRLRVQVLDPYGEVLDMCSAQFSFSVEVLEVRNLSLYNTIRDSLGVPWVP